MSQKLVVVSPSFLVSLLFTGLLINVLPLHVQAANHTNQVAGLSQEQQLLVIKEYANAIVEHYIVPKEAEKYAVFLKNMAKDIERNKLEELPREENKFTEYLNNQLQLIHKDKHLALIPPVKFSNIIERFYDGESPASEKPASSNHQETLSEHDSSSGLAHHGQKITPSIKKGNSLAEIGVLNIGEISRDGLNQTGYISFSRLESTKRVKRFLNMAFSTFSESDQIIIDLRECGGGDAEAVTFLSSFFFTEPTLLSVNEQRDRVTKELIRLDRWTIPNKLSQIFAEKPLKILVSGQTFSAAESFAFSMQNLQRATIIGGVTGGGGYSNDFFVLNGGFGASISVGRTFNPVNGDDWQGKGINPDFSVEVNHALYNALQNYTTESSKKSKFNDEELDIYNFIQVYVEAWYSANEEAMDQIIGDDFQGVYVNAVSGKKYLVSRESLLTKTLSGEGVNTNKIYDNRIIKDISVSDNIATVTLILRKTIHEMVLERKKEGWAIVSDFKTDKLRT
ncbi:S41 family peptidase [Aestuariibacter salexigens]|uniref:S41 family peptidase n=1 Tax=Aestuariibacter salexigens TaxID=226010 RepID=UPI0004225210|nr:S41 family peptidase [Aestuariibacter salexigens]